MKFFIAIFAIAMLFGAVGAGQPASAQTATPQGSWSDSCRNEYMRGTTFVAQCRRDDDSWTRSSIDLSQCRSGSVSNQNGSLVCDRGNGRYNNTGGRYNNGYNANARLPGGTWSNSCRNISMRGSVLTASCQNDSGRYQTSSIDLSQCSQNYVVNRNGTLVCRGQR